VLATDTTKPDPSRVDAEAMKTVQAEAEAKRPVQLQQDEGAPEHSDAYGKLDEKNHDLYEKPYEAADER
jgi:hypothetical protein